MAGAAHGRLGEFKNMNTYNFTASNQPAFPGIHELLCDVVATTSYRKSLIPNKAEHALSASKITGGQV